MHGIWSFINNCVLRITINVILPQVLQPSIIFEIFNRIQLFFPPKIPLVSSTKTTTPIRFPHFLSNQMSTTIVLPGQTLAPTTTHTPGTGVHIHNGQLISSLVGQVVLGPTPTSAPTSKTSQQSLPTLSVHKPTISSDEEVNTTLLPEVGSEIIARVTRISARQATVGIFIVGGRVCGDEFQGVIRYELLFFFCSLFFFLVPFFSLSWWLFFKFFNKKGMLIIDFLQCTRCSSDGAG